MKYSIYINQFCWEKNDFKSLDIIDLALFDAIRCFMISSKAETIVIDRQVYYWVSPNILIKEMPILGITTPRGVNKRLENLIDAKLLERCPDNQSIKRSYFKMGEKYNLYMCNSDENENSSLGTSVPTPTWNEKSKYNNTNIDENTNKETNKESQLNFPYHSSEFMDLWNKVVKLKKWKSKDEGQLQYSLDKLAKVSEEDAIKALQETYESGWQGVFPKTTTNKGGYSSPQQTPPPINNSLPKWKAMGFSSQEEYLKAFGK